MDSDTSMEAEAEECNSNSSKSSMTYKCVSPKGSKVQPDDSDDSSNESLDSASIQENSLKDNDYQSDISDAEINEKCVNDPPLEERAEEYNSDSSKGSQPYNHVSPDQSKVQSDESSESSDESVDSTSVHENRGKDDDNSDNSDEEVNKNDINDPSLKVETEECNSNSSKGSKTYKTILPNKTKMESDVSDDSSNESSDGASTPENRDKDDNYQSDKSGEESLDAPCSPQTRVKSPSTPKSIDHEENVNGYVSPSVRERSVSSYSGSKSDDSDSTRSDSSQHLVDSHKDVEDRFNSDVSSDDETMWATCMDQDIDKHIERNDENTDDGCVSPNVKEKSANSLSNAKSDSESAIRPVNLLLLEDQRNMEEKCNKDESSDDGDTDESPKRITSPFSDVKSESDSDIGSVKSAHSNKCLRLGKENIEANILDSANANEKQDDKKTIKFTGFADDLSDVSDIENVDSFDEPVEKQVEKTENIEFEVEQMQNKSADANETTHVSNSQINDAVSLIVENEDRLDFEAEEGEEGECSGKEDDKKSEIVEVVVEKKPRDDLEDGELTDDEDVKPKESEVRLVCRFYNRGHCTWGTNCRYIHLGVVDKGNYNMFEPSRQPLIATQNGLPPPQPPVPNMMYPVLPPLAAHPLADRLGVNNIAAAAAAAAVIRKEEPVTETAWERGLRQAKEMIRKSTKRKETDIDFEDKKMNLTLGQQEVEKENNYYSRHSSPRTPDRTDKRKLDEVKSTHKPINDHFPSDYPAHSDNPTLGYYPPVHHSIPRTDYWNPHRIGALPYDDFAIRAPHLPYGADYYTARRYMQHPGVYYPPRHGPMIPAATSAVVPSHHSDYYDRNKKAKPYTVPAREVIVVQKSDKSYKDESPSKYRSKRDGSPRAERVRGDEWSDPWMRSKSPLPGHSSRRRKRTYSSKSSYSSSSGSSRSRSSSSGSSSSYTSNSRNSRSKSRSSRSRSRSSSGSHSDSRKKPPMQFKLSPTSRAQLPTSKRTTTTKPLSPIITEKRIVPEKSTPLRTPSPKKIQISTSTASQPSTYEAHTTSPPRITRTVITRPKNVEAPGKKPKSRSKSSDSSSDSSSSDSSSGSSDSSESTSGSSSSSKSSGSPPVRHPKRIPVDGAARLSEKSKSMDAMKVSGQKQQIKLTLKGSSNGSIAQLKATTPQVPTPVEMARKDRLVPLPVSRKRAASSDSGSDSDAPNRKMGKLMSQKKGAPSRREELLKQLKAVEDAIARKRSKIM